MTSRHAAGTFTVASWEEDTYQDLAGQEKLTKARMGFRLTGDLAGDLVSDSLMYYREDGTAEYTGLQRFTGQIAGRSGTCVMIADGGYDGGEARSAWRVIPAAPTASTTSLADPPDGGLDQTANLLGALSLLITDRMADAMAETGGRPESAAAALSALLHFLDRPTVDLLRQVLGLTSSGTVRMVDRMAESGYVQRGPGADGRSTSVSLTGAGRAAAESVAAARAGVLAGALEGL